MMGATEHEALTDEQIEAIWQCTPTNGISYVYGDPAKQFRIRFARLLLAAAQPQPMTDAVRDVMVDAVDRTIKTIERQLKLIEERAPGDYLDKRPVVQSLIAHKGRLHRALAEIERIERAGGSSDADACNGVPAASVGEIDKRALGLAWARAQEMTVEQWASIYGERFAEPAASAGHKWPMLEPLHLEALAFAYYEGYSKAYECRESSNPFVEAGSQAAAYRIGMSDGTEDRAKLDARPAFVKAVAGAEEAIYQVWVEETSSYADVTPEYYAERLPSNRRIVYAAPQAGAMIEPDRAHIDAAMDVARYEYGHGVTRASIVAIWKALGARSPQAGASSGGWQPIETAPKDGRTLLLGYPNILGKWRTVRGQWMSDAYIAEYWEDPDDAESGWYETSAEADDVPNCWSITPTHWMPLPEAPTEKDKP